MKISQQAVFDAFRTLAAEYKLKTRCEDRALVVIGGAFICRIRTESDRERGVFVTLQRAGAEGGHEYALSHIVEFRCGSEADVRNALVGDLDTIVCLTKQYLVEYIVNDPDNFQTFVRSFEEKAATQFPWLRGFTANKWVRAEWIDEQQSS